MATVTQSSSAKWSWLAAAGAPAAATATTTRSNSRPPAGSSWRDRTAATRLRTRRDRYGARGYRRSPMRVTANGDEVVLGEASTVMDLLEHLGLGARWVLVERNGEPVDRAELGTTVLAEGDRLELVRAVAGG